MNPVTPVTSNVSLASACLPASPPRTEKPRLQPQITACLRAAIALKEAITATPIGSPAYQRLDWLAKEILDHVQKLESAPEGYSR